MVFTSEHKRFIIKPYFRNGVFNNGEWTYRAVAYYGKNFQNSIEIGICNKKYKASERLNLKKIWTYVRQKSQRLP
jgi:hypothetical protein